ncbi:hypothetical protein [Pseudoalteromonas denitrificans]|jgi:hypothetical protein|uniref:Uncharacterized protein n=1 Tax=Pseudoalteromonas denitrificans DSM 6059 TaxID=1123010 RepID=A0A1I1RI21_9GAMM|nr:hypothetical protein [Pseudoalteromonas denitrificans]SFD33951.1 hypothetical protein SAMN02745724_04243 [Pseudoalteromonas denitrificans DSM 6059]
MKNKEKAQKQKVKALKQALTLLDEMGNKPKMTAKQFQLITKVKVTLKGVQSGTVTLDKLIDALNKLNASLSETFKL